MTEKTKENKRKSLYTPGFYDDINRVVLEQVKGNKYAVSLNVYLPEDKKVLMKKGEGYGIIDDYSRGEEDYFPLATVAWPLTEKPRNYGSFKQLWQKVHEFIWQHFYVDKEETYDVLAAWVFATYISEVWTVVPYLWFHGPKATGKTRGAEVLHRLCYRGVLCSNISTAALFRAVNEWNPVVLLDESEIYAGENRGDIINLLNSGYRRGQVAIRVKHTEQGEMLECFDVFGFKVIIGTEDLRETLESRCIPIRTIKNRRKVKFFINEKQAEEIRGELLQWRFTYLENYVGNGEGCEPCEGSEGYLEGSGRLQELFTSLLVVSNEGREAIAKFAKNMASERMEEEKTSLDAEIVEVLLKASDNVIENELKERIILTRAVKDKLNESRAEGEKLGSRVVGCTIRRLGFAARHTRTGNGWLYDQDRMKSLVSIYLPSSLEASLPSLPSQPSQEKLLELCKFCGKPITGATHDWVSEGEGENKKDYPAHNDCAYQWREQHGYNTPREEDS